VETTTNIPSAIEERTRVTLAEIQGVRECVLGELFEANAADTLRLHVPPEHRAVVDLLDIALRLGGIIERINCIGCEDDQAAALHSLEEQYLWLRRHRDQMPWLSSTAQPADEEA
jgi:hypothetical protein